MIAPSRPAATSLGFLLSWGVLSLWVPERWAWALFETGVFALTGWCALGRRRIRLPLASIPLAAAAIWPWLQLAWHSTLYAAATCNAALDWATFFLVFALASECFADPEARLWFLQAAVLFGMLVAIVATIGDYACPGRVACVFDTGFRADVMGPFVNRNQFCAWIEILLPVALYLAAVKPRRRVLFGTAGAVMAGAVAASASRAGTLLAGIEIVAVLVALALERGVVRRLISVAAQLVALTAISISIAGWQNAWARWRSGGPEDLRKDALQASWRMVQDRPWSGSGLGTWSRVYPQYAAIDRGLFMNQAHNDWMQWAAEGGLPFFALLFFFAALSCNPAVRSIYGIGVVVFLVHALVDYPMQQRPALAAWFFAMAGVAAACRHRGKPSRDGLL